MWINLHFGPIATKQSGIPLSYLIMRRPLYTGDLLKHTLKSPAKATISCTNHFQPRFKLNVIHI